MLLAGEPTTNANNAAITIVVNTMHSCFGLIQRNMFVIDAYYLNIQTFLFLLKEDSTCGEIGTK